MEEKRFYLVYYGRRRVVKVICPDCNELAIVAKNHFTCCGKWFLQPYSRAAKKRECEDFRKVPYKKPKPRKQPSLARKREALHEQAYACFWCDHAFGVLVYKRGEPVILKVVWDHVVPKAKGGSDEDANFVASCQLCNTLKGAKIFESIGDARRYLKQRWVKKGYSDGTEE